ncbi:MAG TPA: arylamine N-acetyltransferase [Candidatus Acidoferrum sp.]|nr:arylamine N-acetyltransferase [Candidatus Acidoferrum sp.]
MSYPLLDTPRLDRYFIRIGYSERQAADYDTLATLHRLHPQAIAFESLDSWCDHTPSLDPDAVFAKLVTERRGGWCFEQNQLFARVLLTVGFKVQLMAARVIIPERQLPRTHKVLLVTLDSTRWLVDVGYGGMTMTAPLQLDSREPQETPHEPWLVKPLDDEFIVSAQVNGDWTPQFSFSLTRQITADYDMANYVVANHPDSRFRHDLIAARPDALGRHALLNKRLSYHRHGRPSQHRELASPTEAMQALQQVFGINVDGIDGLPQQINRLFAAG